MAKAGAVYPQVELGAARVMEKRVAVCPPRVTIARALARGTGADAVVTSPRAAVRRRDLARAEGWGLGGLRADEMAWHGLPVVGPRATEVEVRRLIAKGAPLVLVRAGRQLLGVVDAERVEMAAPMPSLAGRLERSRDRSGEARVWLLRVAGKVGEGMGIPVFAVGGFVRDLLRHEGIGSDTPDLDLVVEGDGIAFARRLAEEVGGHLVVHSGFATASIEGALGPGGGEPTSLGRVDIASSRREHYEAPGALPLVSPAPLVEDLRRRDFFVNAIALSLAPSVFGRLMDPLGGAQDLRTRRLRVLHPLSFVEDPTRIFRAARYAARLGFRLDASSLRVLDLALKIGRYPALSGDRLMAELELLAGEPDVLRAFELLLRWRALRLWNPGYRSVPGTIARLRAAGRFLAWARGRGIAADPSEVYLMALLMDQRTPTKGAVLDRLALRGEAFDRLWAGLAARALALSLAREERPSRLADLLKSQPMTALAMAWIRGGARVRQKVQWFLGEARAVRPLLTGEDVLALGVPRGPRIGECLAALRRGRLDGTLVTVAQERQFVKEYLLRKEA